MRVLAPSLERSWRLLPNYDRSAEFHTPRRRALPQLEDIDMAGKHS
jgi:hypothetical protein